jgi:ribosomal protein S27AE
MRNHHDLTQKIRDKVDACPQCGGKLKQKNERRITCEQCGFTMETYSLLEQIYLYLGLVALVASGLALVIGFALGKWVQWLVTKT